MSETTAPPNDQKRTPKATAPKETATPKAPTAVKGRNVILPVLPDGWVYEVIIKSGDSSIEVGPSQVNLSNVPEFDSKVVPVGTLDDGVKMGARIARSVATITAMKQKAKDDQEKLLADAVTVPTRAARGSRATTTA